MSRLPARVQPAVRKVASRIGGERASLAARRYGTAYRNLLAILTRRAPEDLGPPSATGPTWEDAAPDRALARRLVSRAEVVERLTSGAGLDDAVMALVRKQLTRNDHVEARALGQALQSRPETSAVGHLVSAVVAARFKFPELAWASFAAVPFSMWRRLAPEEYVRAGLRVDRAAAVSAARRLISERPADVPWSAWTSLAGWALGADEVRLAADLLDVADDLAAGAPDGGAGTADEREALRGWVSRALDPRPAQVPAGHVSLAVTDYRQPQRDNASNDMGDYLQTLASLGHLARHRNLRFHSADGELASVVAELARRVRPELTVDSGSRDVTLVPVSRDASNLESVPPGTWAVLFGSYLNSTYDRWDFPPNRNLQPIFISFHCRPEILTPAAIEYLRGHGPIGCRDWTTVDLLLSVGVPAFFSGCITTTIDTIMPPRAKRTANANAPRAFVDVAGPEGAAQITHVDDAIRQASTVANLRRALDLLDAYRDRYSSIVTSRLHCYLPARSIGAAVEFRPAHPADVQFDGLVGLTDTELTAMRTGLSAKLETVLTAIVAGKGQREVYEIWRELCADDVALAEKRRASVPPMPAPSFDVAAACATIRANATTLKRSVPTGGVPEVNVALALDGNLKEELRVVVTAMAENASRPLHLWILCRDHGKDDFAEFAALFPEVTATWLPCDRVDYGPVVGMLKHITVSTMDRLLLPVLLPELDRIVYHDIDALPLGDVAVLDEWDLQGHPLAARSAVATHVSSGFFTIRRSAERLRDDPSAFYDLLHRMHTRFAYDFVAFNAGILVLDLARMRADDFCQQFLPFVERYGMNDQEVLNCYVGPDRAVLPPQWNALPLQEIVPADPKIIHWAGETKPWMERFVLFKEHWSSYAQRLRDRQDRATESASRHRSGQQR